jgi:hypothetical protein
MTAIETQVSAQVRSAPVVMINFNVPKGHLVPGWICSVDERSHTHTRHPVPGALLIEGKRVDLQDILEELDRENFVPVRLVVIDRMGGEKNRMALVCVRKDQMKPDDRRLPPRDEIHIRTELLKRFWDIRIYRNQGENDGNFVIEAGNPKSPEKFESTADLLIDKKEREFDLLDTE